MPVIRSSRLDFITYYVISYTFHNPENIITDYDLSYSGVKLWLQVSFCWCRNQCIDNSERSLDLFLADISMNPSFLFGIEIVARVTSPEYREAQWSTAMIMG